MSLKAYLIIAALVGGFLLAGASYVWGRYDGASLCQAKQFKSQIMEKEKDDKKLQKVRRLDDDELVKRYCASSVFDVPASECFKRYPLFRQ